ncbi:hypothetical protein IWW34DRAFT_863133 [Fusarium oxysporum f. sp. albedinis]|nr:hypothetical protein IWW34DRAFT_863133 [Fusarium oxysporum f. sp. albedinis]KAK2469184.1 hypothetical protein H9L39_19165 [Fusarium oxysporum f. sp. albedinis]
MRPSLLVFRKSSFQSGIIYINFPSLKESKGLGVWGYKATIPDWATTGLSGAILKAITDEPIIEKAKTLGEMVSSVGRGRDIAVRVVAKLAYAA